SMESANKLQCKCLSIDSYCFSEEFVKLFSAFYVSLDELLVREGAPKKIPECKRIILVVDIDQWEIEQARRQHRCLNSTMDFVALLSNKKMLLVDAKFRVETNELNSSFIQDIKAKLDYTKPLFYIHLPIHEKIILLFQTKKAEQCRNRIRRLMNNKSDIEVMDIVDFYVKYIT
ncbi:hypothetical protein ABH207_11805, partial [Bacteroides ovatus]